MRLSPKISSIAPSITLAITAKAKQMKADGVDVIGFGAGEPDFDTPDNILDAAKKAIDAGQTRYTPVAGTMELRRAVADKLQRENGLSYQPEQVVISAGGKHSLYNIIQALVAPGDEVLIPAPYWVSYPEMVKLADGVPRVVTAGPETNFRLTAEMLAAAITPKTRLLILNSPSNPTGEMYSRDELVALGQVICDHDLYVISDEIYEKLIYDDNEHISIAALSPELYKRTVLVGGVSKAYAMTGWRIGYFAADPILVRAVCALQGQSTSNPCSIAMAAATEALSGPQDEVVRRGTIFEARRNLMVSLLQAIPGVECAKPGGAFYVFPDISSFIGKSVAGRTINSSTDLAGYLLEEVQVALVPGAAFGADKHVRLSYACSTESIKTGVDRIAKALAALS